MIDLIMILVLVAMSAEDIIKKSIGLKQTIILSVAALIYGISVHNFGRENLCGTLIFMLLILVMCFVIKAIGVGDVFVIFMIVCVKGAVFASAAFLLAVTIMAVSCAAMFVFRVITRKQAIPFVPYICLGSMGVMLCV